MISDNTYDYRIYNSWFLIFIISTILGLVMGKFPFYIPTLFVFPVTTFTVSVNIYYVIPFKEKLPH